MVDDRGGDAEVVVCRCVRRGFRRGAHVERFWEEKEGPRSGSGGLTKKHVERQSGGSGRREVSASARGTLPEALRAHYVFAGWAEQALEVLRVEVQHRSELIEICACANDFQTFRNVT